MTTAPDGWQLVPKEPSEQMVEDGRSQLSQGDAKVQTHARVLWVWEAMLAAAPSSPASKGAVDAETVRRVLAAYSSMTKPLDWTFEQWCEAIARKSAALGDGNVV